MTPDGLSSCPNGTAPQSDEKAPDDQTDTTRGAADASKPRKTEFPNEFPNDLFIRILVTETASPELTAPQEEPDASAQDASSTSSAGASASGDPVDKTASLSTGIDLLMDSTGEEQQNQADSPSKITKRSRLLTNAA